MKAISDTAWSEIRKVIEKSKLHYYHVKTKDLSGPDFYVAIDQTNKILLFHNKIDSDPFGKINLNDPNASIKIPPIKPRIIGAVLSKALKAIKENDFPEYISYCT